MAPPGELRVNAGVVWLAGNTVWSTPERIRGEVLTTMRYTNRHLPLHTLPYKCSDYWVCMWVHHSICDARPDLWLPSQLQSINALNQFKLYCMMSEAHVWTTVQKSLLESAAATSWNRDLLLVSPMSNHHNSTSWHNHNDCKTLRERIHP